MARRKAKPVRRSASDHLLTRLAKSECRRCGRPTFAGHIKGEPKRLDRINLTPEGELFALLLGLGTYQKMLGGEVFRRKACHITDGRPRYSSVVAEHRCETVWAAAHIDIRPLVPMARADTPCPF